MEEYKSKTRSRLKRRILLSAVEYMNTNGEYLESVGVVSKAFSSD